jgi:vitamin B12 transporter
MQRQILFGKKIFAFRKWSRKTYAVFNSLKLLIKICVISVAYTLINPVQESHAQSDTVHEIKKIELDEVEVSGYSTPLVYPQLARIVYIVTRSEVEQAPVLSPNDLLKFIPQVDIRQRGINGVQADISIQGGSFDQTLILLNGINLTDPQTGHYNLNLPVSLESIDRIEVLKGPASRVFGTNAFSGAVNFITAQNPKNQLKASFTAGDFGLVRASLYINQHSDKFLNTLALSKGISNGYNHNTDYDQINAFYHGKVFINKSDIGLQFGYAEKSFGANNFYSPKYSNQTDATKTYFGCISGQTGTSVKISPAIYWRRNYDHFVLDRTNPRYYQNFHYTDVYGANFNSHFKTKFGTTAIGLDYRNEIIYSTNLGFTIDKLKKIPGEDSIKYTKNYGRENISTYLEHNIFLEKISASAGMMVNKNSKLERFEFYPGLDLSFEINRVVKWYASLNRSLRMPSFTDLFYKGPQNRGNPFLKPEQAWTVESGFKYLNKLISGNLSYFYRRGTNIIDWIKYPDPDSIWFTTNYTKLNTNGVELFITIKPRNFNISAFFMPEEISFSYSFTSISKKKTEFDSYYALDNLRNKLALIITHKVLKNFGAMWCMTWQDRNGTFNQYGPDHVTFIETSYTPYFLLDSKLYYKKRFLKIFVEVTNIMNTNYVDIGNINQPSRWFKAGFDIDVAWKK